MRFSIFRRTYRVLGMAERSKFVTGPVIRSSKSLGSILAFHGKGPLGFGLDDFAKITWVQGLTSLASGVKTLGIYLPPLVRTVLERRGPTF